MAFHNESNERFALRRRLGEELLGGGANRFRIVLDLELRHGFDGHGDALVRVQILLRSDVERHQLERQLLRAVNERQHELRTAMHDVRAAQSITNERLVRTHLAQHSRE